MSTQNQTLFTVFWPTMNCYIKNGPLEQCRTEKTFHPSAYQKKNPKRRRKEPKKEHCANDCTTDFWCSWQTPLKHHQECWPAHSRHFLPGWSSPQWSEEKMGWSVRQTRRGCLPPPHAGTGQGGNPPGPAASPWGGSQTPLGSAEKQKKVKGRKGGSVHRGG